MKTYAEPKHWFSVRRTQNKTLFLGGGSIIVFFLVKCRGFVKLDPCFKSFYIYIFFLSPKATTFFTVACIAVKPAFKNGLTAGVIMCSALHSHLSLFDDCYLHTSGHYKQKQRKQDFPAVSLILKFVPLLY